MQGQRAQLFSDNTEPTSAPNRPHLSVNGVKGYHTHVERDGVIWTINGLPLEVALIGILGRASKRLFLDGREQSRWEASGAADAAPEMIYHV